MIKDEIEEIDFGCDLHDSLSIDPETGDFRLVEGDENADQGIKNRVLTEYDELAELGYAQYGNNAQYFLRTVDIDIAIPHIEIYVKQAVERDPRVKEVVSIESLFEDNILKVYIRVKKVNNKITDLEPIQWDVFG